MALLTGTVWADTVWIDVWKDVWATAATPSISVTSGVVSTITNTKGIGSVVKSTEGARGESSAITATLGLHSRS